MYKSWHLLAVGVFLAGSIFVFTISTSVPTWRILLGSSLASCIYLTPTLVVARLAQILVNFFTTIIRTIVITTRSRFHLTSTYFITIIFITKQIIPIPERGRSSVREGKEVEKSETHTSIWRRRPNKVAGNETYLQSLSFLQSSPTSPLLEDLFCSRFIPSSRKSDTGKKNFFCDSNLIIAPCEMIFPSSCYNIIDDMMIQQKFSTVVINSIRIMNTNITYYQCTNNIIDLPNLEYERN